MPQTMKTIQEKHEEAMAELQTLVFRLPEGARRDTLCGGLDKAGDAFAAAVQHHTDYVKTHKVATKVAREIEGGK